MSSRLVTARRRPARCSTAAGCRRSRSTSSWRAAAIGTADVPSGRSTGCQRGLRASRRRRALRRLRRPRGGRQRQRRDRPTRSSAGPLPDQRELDATLVELDGTGGQVAPRRERDPRRLAGGRARRAPRPPACPLYRALNANAHVLPVPLVNLINGGKHASNDLDFQEFIVIPVGADSMLEALQISTEVNLALGRDPARPLRQERAQHRRRGRLRAGDLATPRGARSAARGGRPTPATTAASATGSTAPRPTTTTARRGDLRARGRDAATPRR